MIDWLDLLAVPMALKILLQHHSSKASVLWRSAFFMLQFSQKRKLDTKWIRDTKGTFQAKMGTIKDKNGMDLTEAEDIKKRWQEYREELYKKDLHDPDNHDGVITHLEPDILECEVKGALESITMNEASEVMEFQVSYFKSWKMMLWKCCTQYASKFGKLSSAQDWKRSVFISIPKKGNAKECSNYHIIALISHASEVMLKIGQATLQEYMNGELPEGSYI